MANTIRRWNGTSFDVLYDPTQMVTSLTGTANEITVSAATGAVTLSLPATISADLNGNATTATTLQTARNFSLTGDVTAGPTSFNGSAALSLATTVSAGVITNAMLSSATGEPNNASWVAYTPVVQSGGVNVTLGTGGAANGVYIRLGKWIYCMGDVRFSTSGGAAMTAGTITVGLPTIPTLFASSLLLLGNLRATGLTGGLFFHTAHPIGTVASQQVSWKYSAAYPSGADANFTTTTPNTLILNAANAFRMSWTCLYLSST